jgi:acyl-coenzyme A synthetase/AMP-(fatty) acid ligase
VFPTEIEETIEKHPAVATVCVTGIPDPELLTDLPAAAVVKKDGALVTEEELIDFVHSNLKSDYKRLRGGVYFVDDLPKTFSSKVQRKKVQQIIVAKYRQTSCFSVQC